MGKICIKFPLMLVLEERNPYSKEKYNESA